jgi:hypothetical protein
MLDIGENIRSRKELAGAGATDLLQIIDDLVAEIRKCAVYALGWRIMMGVRLREYRDDLESDDWSQLLHSGRLPFSARTAQMLTRLGDHKILSNTERTHQLPDSITVLNEIAALPRGGCVSGHNGPWRGDKGHMYELDENQPTLTQDETEALFNLARTPEEQHLIEKVLRLTQSE